MSGVPFFLSSIDVSFSVGFNLSGNKSNPALRSDGKKSKEHTMVFTADAIQSNAVIQMSRGGMILFALMSGGDYDKVRFTISIRCDNSSMSRYRVSTSLGRL